MSAALDLGLDTPTPPTTRPALRLIEGGAAKAKKGLPASWSRPSARVEFEVGPQPGVARVRVAPSPTSNMRTAMRWAMARGLPVSWVTVHEPEPEPAPKRAPNIETKVYPETAGTRPCGARSSSTHGATPCKVPACIAAEARHRQKAHVKATKAGGPIVDLAFEDDGAGAGVANLLGAPSYTLWRQRPSEAKSLLEPAWLFRRASWLWLTRKAHRQLSLAARVSRGLDHDQEDFALDRLIESVRVKGARLPPGDALVSGLVDRDDLLGEAWIELVCPFADTAEDEAPTLARGDDASIRRLADKALDRAYRRIRPDLKKA